MFAILSCVILVLSCILYYSFRFKYNYWKDRNVPFLKPSTFFGNYKDYILMKVYHPTITAEICKQFPDAPYIGVFYGTEPALIVKDLELLKLITTKDFYYFNGREASDHNHKEVITQNIFFTQGERWKILRQNLTPLFSTNKIKNMFYLIKKCATEFESALDNEFKISPTVAIRSLTTRYTIDVIVLCAFGINANVSGDAHDTNPFKLMSKKTLEVSLTSGIKNCFRSIWPRTFYALGLRMFSLEVDKFFNNLLKEVFEQRDYKPSSRHDFVDLILSLYQKKIITGDPLRPSKSADAQIKMKVDDDFLVGQCVAFFAAGFEASANILHFVLYEFAKHEDIQKRAVAEVDAYLFRHKDGVEYDIVNEVPYLEACVDEAMRIHPLLGTLTRETMEDYTLPDGLVLEKGLRIHIPVRYLHLNPDHFPNPEEFDPERFLGERRTNINAYTYYAFGIGPRMCIGLRFAKLLVLTGLATILKKYTVKLAEGTPRKVHYEPKALSAQPIDKIWLTLIPRN